MNPPTCAMTATPGDPPNTIAATWIDHARRLAAVNAGISASKSGIDRAAVTAARGGGPGGNATAAQSDGAG